MTAPNFGGKVANEKTNEEGTLRGPFLPDGAFPYALLLGAIVFRIAMRAVATCVTVIARLFRQRGLFGRQMPDGTRFRHVSSSRYRRSSSDGTMETALYKPCADAATPTKESETNR